MPQPDLIQQLRHHEHYLDSIISRSADAIITLDDDLVIQSWNRGAFDIYGYTDEEAIGQHINLLIPDHLKDEGEIDHILSLLDTHGVVQNYETIRQAKDARRVYVQFTATRLLDEHGGPTGLISVIVRNITERKELEQRLERKIDGLFIINEIGRALQRTTDLDEILYIVLVGVTAGQALKFNRAFLLLLDTEQTRLEGRMAIGPSDPAEAKRIWSDLGKKHFSLNDILRSYRAETTHQDTRIQEAVRQISIPLSENAHILIRSLETRSSFNIPHARRHKGVPQKFLDIIESNAFAIVPLFSQEQLLGVLIADNFITGRPILDEDVELLEIFAQKASATIENSILYETQNQQVRALEEANNNLKLYQEKLIHAERLSAIGEMAAMVAHEIRNPLVSIGGFARALRRKMPEDTPYGGSLDIIIKEGMRLEEIVKELLDLARPFHVHNAPSDMNHLITDALLFMHQDLTSKQIRVQERLDPDITPVPMDTDHIKQVLLNFFKNAIDAMPICGTLSVWTSQPNKAFIEVGVSDTGPGIAEENIDKIYDPFFTTKPGGSGLGLTVAFRIIHDHGGTLDVISSEEEGTSFILHLPIVPPLGPTDKTDLEQIKKKKDSIY